MLLLFSGGSKHINIVKKGKPCTILVFDSDLNCIDKQTDTKRLLTVSFVPAAALRLGVTKFGHVNGVRVRYSKYDIQRQYR